jgi:hypothetical protein
MEKRLIVELDAPEADEAIVAAAIRVHDRIFTGPTHMDAVLNFFRDPTVTQAERSAALADDRQQEMDGFLTTKGRFVGREEGYALAQAAKQLKSGWEDAAYASKFTGSPEPKLDSGWLAHGVKPTTESVCWAAENVLSKTGAERKILESAFKVLLDYV